MIQLCHNKTECSATIDIFVLSIFSRTEIEPEMIQDLHYSQLLSEAEITS
jgi:hypothetical protein